MNFPELRLPLSDLTLSEGLAAQSIPLDPDDCDGTIRIRAKNADSWEAEISVRLDLGMLGTTELWATIPRVHFSQLARHILATSYTVGERVVILDSEFRGEHGTVRKTTDDYGCLEVAGDKTGLRRVPAAMLTRPRTMEDPA
ncbi:hypothetical protein [Gordonia sp. (in: high G+C Gram-positive bacteria)]|uniref:hypothetical protein n=1 Tax=Gordonia sp. (in: high G+C Gram-positive bacteria) TaxID=84139 RepID=UPI003C78A69A